METLLVDLRGDRGVECTRLFQVPSVVAEEYGPFLSD